MFVFSEDFIKDNLGVYLHHAQVFMEGNAEFSFNCVELGLLIIQCLEVCIPLQSRKPFLVAYKYLQFIHFLHSLLTTVLLDISIKINIT